MTSSHPPTAPRREYKRGEIVHVLRFGVSLCRTPKGLPFEWPPGHTWERESAFAAVPLAHKCPRCVTALRARGIK